MAEYYIDLLNGAEDADGKSPEHARKNYKDLDIAPGDKVLFKRGTFVRDTLKTVCGEPENPVTYGAYGEGAKPVFCGSVDVSGKDAWVECEKNIWKCTKAVPTEAANFIYDYGKSCGALRWTYEELSSQGDWYDNRFGSMRAGTTGYCQVNPNYFKGEQELCIYSEGNPGEYYSHIECAVYGEGRMAACDHDTVFEDLAFQNSGVHGICGAGVNITIRNCDFTFIGGAVIMKDKRIRFGNCVEFWEVCDGCVVEDCSFHNVYDSGITHQGKVNAYVPKNNRFDNNFFSCCGMAAYECRDFLPINTSFNGNTCINSGEGFSRLGEVLPRNSEIYPLPMGHHVFIWRVEKQSPDGHLVMKNNKFLNAPIGAAILSMASREATEQMEIDGNIYFSENTELCNYFYGNFFATFEDYQREMGMDKNGRGLPCYYK